MMDITDYNQCSECGEAMEIIRPDYEICPLCNHDEYREAVANHSTVPFAFYDSATNSVLRRKQEKANDYDYKLISVAIDILCVTCSAPRHMVIDQLTDWLWTEEEAQELKSLPQDKD
jgi:hypothetical protein